MGTASLDTASLDTTSLDTTSLTSLDTSRAACTVFTANRVDEVLKDLLDAYLWGLSYDPGLCSQRCHDLCCIIKDRLKAIRLQRHKLVVQVIIGQDSDRSLHLANRTLANPNTDCMASAVYRNRSLFAIALVFAMYSK
jgi:hypothetical protein